MLKTVGTFLFDSTLVGVTLLLIKVFESSYFYYSFYCSECFCEWHFILFKFKKKYGVTYLTITIFPNVVTSDGIFLIKTKISKYQKYVKIYQLT